MPAQTSAQVAAGFRVGDVLAGKYRIEQVLGIGGMGVVVAARHIQLDEEVAIKFLLPEMLGNQDAVARFAREARAAVKIKNEHVARVMDVGTLDDGAPYMVMEYLKGADLSEVLERRGVVSVADTVEYVLQACEALAEAHALGIVHRDLKPANLFLMRQTDGTDSIKVLDFGISKMTGLSKTRSGMAMTGTLAVMGSPLYMSPEQMSSSRDVDTRTDIWAIGAILYELVTGKPPFDAETIPQLCAMILQERPPPMASLRPDAPRGLEAVVLRCLEKDREYRYPNVGELAVDLYPFGPKRARLSLERIGRMLENTGSGTITVPSSVAPPPMPFAAEEDQIPTAPRLPTVARASRKVRAGERRSRALIVGSVLAIVLLAGVGAWMLAREAPPEGAATEWVVRPAVELPPAAAGKEPAPAMRGPAPPPAPPPVVAEPRAVPPPAAAAAPPPHVESVPSQPATAPPSVTPRPAPAALHAVAPPQPPTSVLPGRRAAPATPPAVTSTTSPPELGNPYRRSAPPGAPQAPKPPKQAPAPNDDIWGSRK